MQNSHRARKKRRQAVQDAGSANGTVELDSSTGREKPSFPLVAFFWPAKSASSQWVLVPSVLMLSGLLRWCTAIWPYSGFAKPPMHGDFEAQRHWMELTIHLPMTHWYFHDLEWWGLDYPPLTAYHSWLCGQIGSLIDPSWFALHLSHGSEVPALKVFMRATVFISEYIIYIPATVVCVRHLAGAHNTDYWKTVVALAAILIQPATILIDHGHFQYNTVMLGFVIASLSNMLAGRDLWACIFFVAALGFKQMALFYAPAVAAYLAGSCLFPTMKLVRLGGIAFTTLASFALLFFPIVLGTLLDTYRQVPLPSDAKEPPILRSLFSTISQEHWYYPYLMQISQAVHRIFPFSRGLFEDKVANIWCAIHASGVHKLHQYEQFLLSRAALSLTLLSILPPCLIIFFQPRRDLLPLALATTAWGFFLCSYQVHEKNVLLPLLPMTLLLATKEGLKVPIRAWVGFANSLGCWTLYPLLKRDGLVVPYAVLTLLWAFLLAIPPWGISAYTKPKADGGVTIFTTLIHLCTVVLALSWHVCEAFVLPPAKMSDLWVVANVCLGTAGFGLCYLWCLWNLALNSGALRAIGIGGTLAVPGKKQQ